MPKKEIELFNTIPLEHALALLSLSFLASEIIVFVVRVSFFLVLYIVALIVAATQTGSAFTTGGSFRLNAIAHIADLSSRPVHVAALRAVPIVRIAVLGGAGRIMRRSGRQHISTMVSLSGPGPRSRSRSGERLRLAAQIASTSPGKIQILAGTVRAVPVIVLHPKRPAAAAGDVAVTRRHRLVNWFFLMFKWADTLR